MGEGWRQTRLMLWKDFLIRRRKLVTLCGILWAAAVMISLVIVRSNIDTEYVPTCQFPARALPSAGMLNFLQSLICSINNQCTPLDQYEEIPTYENSRLRVLEKQFGPLLYNDSILEVAAVVPDALKLVATFANIVDEPDFRAISKSGIRVSDLFINPDRVKRYVSKTLGIQVQLVDEVMKAEISFQGIFNSNLDKCDAASLAKVLLVNNTESLPAIVSKVCPMSDGELEQLLKHLLPEINYRKYLKMVGKMLKKLNGHDWFDAVGDMIVAVMRMTNLESFVPIELTPLLLRSFAGMHDNNFTYFNLTIVNKLMDLFEPTFGDTNSFKTVRGLTDSMVSGVQWLYSVIQKQMKSKNGTDYNSFEHATEFILKDLMVKNSKNVNLTESFRKISLDVKNGLHTFNDIMKSAEISISNVFATLSKLTSMVMRFFPQKTQHDILFYSTLMTKLVEGTHRTIWKNVHMDEIIYNASRRNPNGVKVLTSLPPFAVAKIFDALTDAERTQVLTSKITHPGQMFCDSFRLQKFFQVSKNDTETLRKQLCTDSWKNYVSDIITSFGIFDIKNNINNMASLVVTETIGKDNSDQLYSIDKSFHVLEMFMEEIKNLSSDEQQPHPQWSTILDVSEDSEFYKIVQGKLPLVNKILITVHGALAHEVVKQNPILEAKIAPILIDCTKMVTALNVELDSAPRELIEEFKKLYPEILKSLMETLLHEEKTFKTLSTHSTDIFCKGSENASHFIEFQKGIQREPVVAALCQLSTEFEKTFSGESHLAKTIKTMMTTQNNPNADVDWTKLITNLKKLYTTLEDNYPYLFKPTSYNMNELAQKEVDKLVKGVKLYWLDENNLHRVPHLIFKIGFVSLDILDTPLFNITNEIWTQIKNTVDSTNSLIVVADQLIKLTTALSANESYEITNLPNTVHDLKLILPNIPKLITDTADLLVADNTEIAEIINILNSNPVWPCSNRSMSEVLAVSQQSRNAIKGIESFLCLGTGIQLEWANYVDAQKVKKIAKVKRENNTEYEPHLFLKFSGNFDDFVTDVSAMQKVLSRVIGDLSSDNMDSLTFIGALNYAVKTINGTDLRVLFRNVFTKLDTVLEAVDTTALNDSVAVINMWESFLNCSNATLIDDACKNVVRMAWKYTFKFASAAADAVLTDLITYFTEVNEPNANLLQTMGFTSDTGLHILYKKLPDFMGVLLNSYWDHGFMNQVRRASKTVFWDCDAVVDSLVIPVGSLVTYEDIRKVRPYVCPSALFWLSLPRGENTWLNIIAKPQYYFFNLQANNLTSSYVAALENAYKFSELLAHTHSPNITDISKNNETIDDRMYNAIDGVLRWKLTENDASYKLFNEINKKQFVSAIYLTHVAALVNKVAEALEAFNVTDSLSGKLSIDATKKLNTDMVAILKLFKRRPENVLLIHFDAITDVLWRNDKDYKLLNALDFLCENLKNNVTDRDILSEKSRTKAQLCSKDYRIAYGAIQDEILDDTEGVRESLQSLVDVLQKDKMPTTDIVKFFHERKELMNLLKLSMKYSDDIGLAIYVKYLQSNLQHYDVALAFVAGQDWWEELRALYAGPYAMSFFNILESSFDIANDIMQHLDKIQIVRILKDISLNSTETFCSSNITLSDYIPDKTGALSKLKDDMCTVDRIELFKELPPLLFASQGYDIALKLSKEVNYSAINSDILKITSKLDLIKDGPKEPLRPSWITEQKINELRQTFTGLFSKRSLVRISFGVITNIVDGLTLFPNISKCAHCSSLTTWLKQINLQLIKKSEYDTLLCHMDELALEDIYLALKSNFHWDMALQEIISDRSYIKYELNKAINEFLEHIKLYLLNDMSSNSVKLVDCLAGTLNRNEFGNATMFVTVVGKTMRLLRSMTPHLQEVHGMKDVPLLKKLSKDIARNMHVQLPLVQVILDKDNFTKALETIANETDLVQHMNEAMVDLYWLRNSTSAPLNLWIILPNSQWTDVCKTINCTQLSKIVDLNINKTIIDKELPVLQLKEFWSFSFVSDIILHVERLLLHFSRLLTVGSKIDIAGVFEGKISSLVDAALQILEKNTSDMIFDSLQGIITELHPLLSHTAIEYDLESLSKGLEGLSQFKENVIQNTNLKVEVSKIFANPESLERQLNALGINNTNFWSIAAPRIHAGYIDLKPVLTAKGKQIHIKNFVCQQELMSRVILPSNIDVVTVEDVYEAVIDQFCAMPEHAAKQMLPVLLKSLNYTYVLNNVMDMVLLDVYRASNLSEDEGSLVISKYNDMISLLPLVQENFANVSDIFKEPLFASLQNFDSISGLLSSSAFLESAGNMLCGKPLVTNNNRFYKAIAETKDFTTEADPQQLEALPTNFCRSLYKDILNMGGGKIIWSFVKPLIMGKILYTPQTRMVHQIVQKANESFAQMSRMRDLVHGFAGSFGSLEVLSLHRDGLTTLRGLMGSPMFKQFLQPSGGDLTESEITMDIPDIDLGSLFDEFGDLKSMGNLLTKLSNLLECINMNRFHAMKSEHKLSNEAVKLTMINEFSAGLVFLNAENEPPKNIEYKIRMDIDSVPTTSRKRNQFWTPGPEASFIEHMRYFRGFVQIQDMIDKAIIETYRNSTTHAVVKRDLEQQAANKSTNWAIYTQQMPYPCYKKDIFQSSLYESQALLVAFFFSLIFTVSSAVRFIVWEKESGNTTLMSVMGLKLKNNTVSWFVASFLEMLVTMTAMFLVLKLGVILPHSDPFLLWLIMVNFGFSVLMFCYMVSKLFNSASLGAVCTGILYLITFLPFIIILSMEAVLSTTEKVFSSLSMSTGFCYSLLYVARYEAIGTGAQWDNVWNSPEHGDSMSIAGATLMVFVDALLYALIGWIINRTTENTSLEDYFNNTIVSSDKAGVSIVNVSKIYAEGSSKPKLALDNVSVELHRGQITSLLGHNGAGKTTLIKIITGMLKPTKGHIVIRTGDSPSEESNVRLGVCPQNDVLFENMTTVEHLKFYAQLKSGLKLEDVELEVQNMLHVLSFGGLAYEQVSRLSGGLRRRLCVALAFIARPQLVLLDEPSSGVDPVARRDIWSLIVKLKEDRTVLLTTHHLDEAELLSDQIVIMHKGQIHTTGSPIEIKRGLGNGYKLTVVYPKLHSKPNHITQEAEKEEEKETDDHSIEEQTKKLLTVVRSVIENVQLVDVNGLEIELMLPFFNVNGMNNDFLSLCTMLESKQDELQFSSYGLDCTSLEQVFFNICQHVDSRDHIVRMSQEGSADYSCSSSSSSQDYPTKAASTSSVKDNDKTPLVPDNGRIKGTSLEQYTALLRKRWIHYSRNWWLLFLLLALPMLFVTIAMAFSLIRPPADNEIALKLNPNLYEGSTEFVIPRPSRGLTENIDQKLAEDVMMALSKMGAAARNWTEKDSPQCQCGDMKQECDYQVYNKTSSETLLLPNSTTLMNWLISSQERYIEKRYGGWSSSLKNNMTNLVAWYNNKGHHAMPAYVNSLNTAILRTVTEDARANITTYTHPLKISEEQLSKSTLLQHVADIGIAAVILIGFSLIPAGAAIYIVSERESQQKRLQLLCGVSPNVYWMATMTWDMIVIVVNIILTVCVLEAFGLPVFVEKDNLSAICLLLFLFGFACNALVHIMEKLFSDASLANMLLFCGNLFIGAAGLAILLILDIISDSDFTDNVRWTLHKIFLLSPQFVLGDGLVEIAKNSIQAQVLKRFGMDTYKSPLGTDLIVWHYVALALVGTALVVLNLAIENDWLDKYLARYRQASETKDDNELEEMDVATERYRVEIETVRASDVARPRHLHTIGNINAGFVDSEGKRGSKQSVVSHVSDIVQCLGLRREYRAVSGRRVAVQSLTLGIPPGQCLALLGENGAGKSTTFSMLTGELRPTAGSVLLMEKRVKPRDMCQGYISYCPQSDAIDPLLSVRQLLQLYCCLRGITAQREVIQKTLERFDLKKYADQLNCTLSGGNKRKLCTAVALMGRTPLILLDEPTSGMDPSARDVVARGVRAACGSRRAVLLSTHALPDARRLAARVALLQRGRLRAIAPTHDCLARFGGGYVVAVRVGRGEASRVWAGVHSRLPHAKLQAQHSCSLQFLLPVRSPLTCSDDKREGSTPLSEVFRTMASLQGEYDIEDYTLNQSSLDQMFVNFSTKRESIPQLEAIPSPDSVQRQAGELDSVTAL